MQDRPTSGTDRPLKDRIAAYWNTRSDDFDRDQGIRHRRQKEAWMEFLSRHLGRPPVAVLDVGTGTGFLALLAAELGFTTTGLDLSAEMLGKAREHAAARGLTLRLEVGDAENLPDPDATYDVVVNRNSLWTLPQPERALTEWRRVLKPGGLLLLVDGDWFDDRLSYRLRQFAGNAILAVLTRSNPWAAQRRKRRDYNTGFEGQLPLMRPGNRQRMPELVRACGFVEVELLPMREVNVAEKADKNLVQRLLQPHEFFAVHARKP